MRIALLLRGFHYLTKDRFGFPLDCRELIPSLKAEIIAPLLRRYDVDLFAATYPSPIAESLFSDLKPKSVLFLNSRTSNQIDTFCAGLELIRSSGPYDRVISTRFDLLYLKSIETWPIWQRQGVFLLWREYEEFWRTDQRVGDAIHVIDWPTLAAFLSGLASQQPRSDMHLLYGSLEKSGVPLHFLEEGFYDSNTLFSNPECANPLYRIGNRPRLPIPNPYAPPHPAGRRRMAKIFVLNLVTKAIANVIRVCGNQYS